MRCQNCSAENPQSAKFCIQCATPLRRLCQKCGSGNPPEARFCAQCETSLTGDQVGQPSRAAAGQPPAELHPFRIFKPAFAAAHDPLLSLRSDAQLIEQCLGVLKIGGVEALIEPAWTSSSVARVTGMSNPPARPSTSSHAGAT